MGAPSKQALEFQRHLISVDAATMKVAKMYSIMQEKDRTNELLQEQITRLTNENRDITKKLEVYMSPPCHFLQYSPFTESSSQLALGVFQILKALF